MKKVKVCSFVGFVFMIAVVFTACGGGNNESNAGNEATNNDGNSGNVAIEGEFSIVVGHGVAPGTTFDKAMHKFKELVEERTDGRISVSVHPGAALGAEPDLFQGLVEGTVDVMITAPGSLGDFVPELSLFDLAFLIEDVEHQRNVTQGEVGQELARIMEEKTGVITMGYGGGAARSMYFTEPASSLDDIQGRTFRALPTAHPFFSALGLETTFIPHPEIYTALQQGVIDGGENEPFFTISEGFYEPAPNYLLTQHDITVRPVLISKHTLDRLPEELHSIVLQAGKEAADYEYELEIAAEQEAIDKMRADGVNVVELTDKSEFIERVKPVWYSWAEQYNIVHLLENIIELREN